MRRADIKVAALVLACTILVATAAGACSDHRRKPVTCTSTTNIVGTTKTVCR